jgi:hypothetical protein
MSARAELARRVLEALERGEGVPTQDALQLRNWANSPEDSVLTLKEIAERILEQEASPNADPATSGE